MPDVFTVEKRSWIMSRVRRADTRPERLLRKALWSLGLRGWRLQRADLPGRPDVVFPRWRVAVFVDGAFWHGHPAKFKAGRSGAFWDLKIAKNIARDKRSRARLRRTGWSVVRCWDHDVIKDPHRSALRVAERISFRKRAS